MSVSNYKWQKLLILHTTMSLSQILPLVRLCEESVGAAEAPTTRQAQELECPSPLQCGHVGDGLGGDLLLLDAGWHAGLTMCWARAGDAGTHLHAPQHSFYKQTNSICKVGWKKEEKCQI